MESIIGIIPARGGSKRLPGKNLKLLGGISLLERTIRQARKALPVSIVSSDSTEIINETLRCGITALLRPPELATDTATSAAVVNHVIWTFPDFEWFCLLQPTSPLRTVDDILACIDLADQSGRPVVSVYKGLPNGAVYIHPTLSFKGDFCENAVLYEMPEERSIDIDTLADFTRAEAFV